MGIYRAGDKRRISPRRRQGMRYRDRQRRRRRHHFSSSPFILSQRRRQEEDFAVKKWYVDGDSKMIVSLYVSSSYSNANYFFFEMDYL